MTACRWHKQCRCNDRYKTYVFFYTLKVEIRKSFLSFPIISSLIWTPNVYSLVTPRNWKQFFPSICSRVYSIPVRRSSMAGKKNCILLFLSLRSIVHSIYLVRKIGLRESHLHMTFFCFIQYDCISFSSIFHFREDASWCTHFGIFYTRGVTW